MKYFWKILTRLFLFSLFVAILILIVALARGYRFSTEGNTITSTGIVALSSAPTGAKIFINDDEKSAGVTNTNITLPYGRYKIRVTKEGFTTWQNEITLKGELVYNHDVVLFPKNPSLSPLTNFGVMKAIPVGQVDKVLIFVQNGDIEKDGIYLLDGNNRKLTILSPLKTIILLSTLPKGIDLAQTEVEFSADFSEGIFTFTNPTENRVYSYSLSLENTTKEPFEVTNAKASISAAWKKDKMKTLRKIVETFPPAIENIATDSFKIISFSPDETKVLYQAKRNVTLPLVIKPPLVGTNQTQEYRTLEVNNVYVYDRKEDKNFLIPVNTSKFKPPEPSTSPTPSLELESLPVDVSPATTEPDIEIDTYYSLDIANYIQWYPSSRHLVINEGKNFTIMEYDGTNKQSVYSGPYDSDFYMLNSGWKLLILANLNPQNNTYGDIYEVGIR